MADTIKKIPFLFLALSLVILCMGYLHALPLPVKAEVSENNVAVFVDGSLFTVYKFGDKKQKYPYFFPVNGPSSGLSITTESSEPYPHHHSLFFGCDKVNGGNYWQDSLAAGRIRSTALRVIEAEGTQVVFENECEWAKGRQDPVLRDTRRITVSAPDPTLRIIDFEITLMPLVEVTVEKTNHSLFAARMKPEISVEAGGTLINTYGDQKETGTFGKAAPWCDFYGINGKVTEGLAILQHPDNPLYPAPWFTRDYGFFSPTPMYWPPEDKALVFAEGESISLKYRVVVHEGNTGDANIAALFEAYSAEKTKH